MLNAYRNKKDLYATIAMGVYNNNYEDNLEHYPDGTKNSAGAERRSSCKSLLLGLMYGRGAPSIAEQIKKSVPEAQKIIDNFYNSYPRVKAWMDETLENARINGYVEDMWGRRRHLPDIQREPVEVKYTDKSRASIPANFNPLLGSTGMFSTSTKSDLDVFRERALACKNRKEMEKIKSEALAKGIEVHENGGFIAQAERQCVNSRIQGGASTITKLAMINVYNDEELRNLGFKLLICVHDELIGECPEDVKDQVASRLSQVMIDAVKDTVICPMKCDSNITNRWYEDEIASQIKTRYNNKKDEGLSESELFEYLKESYPYLLDDELQYLLNMEA